MTITRGQWLKYNETATKPYTDRHQKVEPRTGADPRPLGQIGKRGSTSAERTRRARAAAKEAE